MHADGIGPFMAGLLRAFLLLASAAPACLCASCGDRGIEVDAGSETDQATETGDDGGGEEPASDPDTVEADAGEDREEAEGEPDAPPDFTPNPDRIIADIAYLASDPCAGREAGTPGNDLALDYVEGLLRDLGLQPAGDGGTFRRSFEFPMWRQTAPPRVTLEGAELQSGVDFVVFRYSPSGAASGPILFAGYGLVVPPFDPVEYPECPIDPAGYDDFAGLDLTGAVILKLKGVPNDSTRISEGCPVEDGLAAAEERGAAAVITVMNYRWPPAVMAGVTVPHDNTYGIPLILADRSLMEASIPDLHAWASEIDARYQPGSRATGLSASMTLSTQVSTASTSNILGVMPGSDPSLSGEVVLVGAHIDHLAPDPSSGTIYPGAVDNASGTALVVELARGVVQAIGNPSRTVLFAAWNAEECRMLGSCAYTAAPSYPLAATRAVLNIDGVGGGSAAGLWLLSGTFEANAWLSDLMFASMLDRGIDGSLQRLPYSENSDHACFIEMGVSTLSVSSIGDYPYVHSPGDTVERIHADDLMLAARMMWALLEPLALGTEALY